MTPAELEALVAEGSAKDVLEATRGLSEKERRALAPAALRLAKHYWSAHLGRYVIDVSRPDVDEARAQARSAHERHAVACAALLGSRVRRARALAPVRNRRDQRSELHEPRPVQQGPPVGDGAPHARRRGEYPEGAPARRDAGCPAAGLRPVPGRVVRRPAPRPRA